MHWYDFGLYVAPYIPSSGGKVDGSFGLSSNLCTRDNRKMNNSVLAKDSPKHTLLPAIDIPYFAKWGPMYRH